MNRLPETNEGVVTSWIPIPTAHPHQPGCESMLWKFVPNILAAWDPGYGLSVQTDVTCHPKPVTTWWLQDRLGPISDTIVSLGPVTCPQDYFTATVSAKDASSTFVACCPFNYEFEGIMEAGSTGQCTSQVKKGSVVTFAVRDPGWKMTSSTATADTVAAAIQVNGWTFATPTSSTTGSATESTNNCAASVTDALASQIATANASCDALGGNRISAGAAAGIGIGVSIGVTGLAALGAGLFMMYRTRKAARRRPAAAGHIAQFVSSGGKDTNTSSQVLPTYSPDRQQTPSPSEMPQYQSYERDVWDMSAPCLPAAQPNTTHSNARTVPHGEMEGTPYQNMDSRTRRRMELEGIPFQEMDSRTIGVGASGPSQHGSEEELRRRMELQGEFDRNVKVSLSTPWLASARPVPPPSTSSTSQYYPPP